MALLAYIRTSRMNRLNIILILMILSGLFSCKKKINEIKELTITSETNPITTTNGKITLTIEVKHHSRPMSEFIVFIKNDATQFPGEDVSVYDFSGPTNQIGFIQFENLSFGNYYLYGNGYDYEIADSVIGYTPILIDSSTVDKVGLNYEINKILYVSEQH